MDPGTHFAFGTHAEHGFVAAFTATMPAHLGHWFLTREQFEPVPGHPWLFRLTEPGRDGARRARHAVNDLRVLGYTVSTDLRLDPDSPSRSVRPSRSRALPEWHARLAQAAAVRSPQHRATPPTTAPAPRPIPPKPAYAPTVHVHTGRSR